MRGRTREGFLTHMCKPTFLTRVTHTHHSLMLGRPSMGGPMGFAVTTTTTTTTSSRALRHGLSPRVVDLGDETHHLTDDQKQYLDIMLNLFGMYELRNDTDKSMYALEKKLLHPTGKHGDDGEFLEQDDEDILNLGMTSCIDNRAWVNTYILVLAKMLSCLGTVTDEDINNKWNELLVQQQQHLHPPRTRLVSNDLDRLESFLYGAMRGPLSHNRMTDVLCLVHVDFLRQFTKPTNTFTRSYCRAVSRRFSQAFKQKERNKTVYTIDENDTWLRTFLTAGWMTTLLSRKDDVVLVVPKQADAEKEAAAKASRTLAVEACLAVVRVLCVVPFHRENVVTVTDGKSLTPPAAAGAGAVSPHVLPIGNLHVATKKRYEASLLMMLLTLEYRDVMHTDRGFAAPRLDELRTFLVNDAGILDANADLNTNARELSYHEVTSLHIFLFIVALMYRACEPYNTNVDQAVDNMNEFLLPFFHTIFDILSVRNDILPKKGETSPQWLAQLKFVTDKTVFMRKRIATALFETDNEDVGENYFVSQLDGVLWASPDTPREE